MSDQLHNLSDEQNSTKTDTPYHYELSAMLQQIAQGASASQNSIKNCSKSIFLSRSISLFILVLAASLLVYVISASQQSCLYYPPWWKQRTKARYNSSPPIF